MAQVTYLRARDESLPAGGNPPVAAYTIPVTRGLRAAYLFSGGAALAHRNYAPGATDGRVVGEPQDVDRFVRFSGTDQHIATGVGETLAVTCFIIARAPAGENAGFIGSPGGSDNAGFSMYASGGSGNLNMNSETTAGRVITSMAVPTNQWGFYVGITPPTGGREQLRDLTRGTVVTNANTANRRNQVVDGLLIGTLAPGSTWRTADILLAAYYDAVLSDTEIAAMTEWGRAYAADFGIAV